MNNDNQKPETTAPPATQPGGDMYKDDPIIPTCPTCKNLMTQCKCQHNNLKK